MKIPDLPEDERTRLETLRSLNLLDTAPEERFDRLTRLAKRLFGVPISLVSLVDEQRQWFKSCDGFNLSETPRNISFCGHAILGEGILMIPDTFKDARFADNPMVLNPPNIRFYAGTPLRVANGSKLGTLCILDTEPRDFTEEDLGLLRDLAVMAEQELAAIQLATLDELTLISNRRGFLALAQHALNLCNRKGMPSTVIYFDLNRFKDINDRYGHAEGDKALIGFADTMRATFRDSDVYARIGGDEFVVFLADIGPGNIDSFLARFEHAIQKHNDEAQRGYAISYSAGYVCCPANEQHAIQQILSRADALMYQKKPARKQRGSTPD